MRSNWGAQQKPPGPIHDRKRATLAESWQVRIPAPHESWPAMRVQPLQVLVFRGYPALRCYCKLQDRMQPDRRFPVLAVWIGTSHGCYCVAPHVWHEPCSANENGGRGVVHRDHPSRRAVFSLREKKTRKHVDVRRNWQPARISEGILGGCGRRGAGLRQGGPDGGGGHFRCTSVDDSQRIILLVRDFFVFLRAFS